MSRTLLLRQQFYDVFQEAFNTLKILFLGKFGSSDTVRKQIAANGLREISYITRPHKPFPVCWNFQPFVKFPNSRSSQP